MSVFYPKAALKLTILLEDYKPVSDASKGIPKTMFITPKSITVNQNDHRTSSTFNCEIEYKNFPFDPRALRYVGVTVYMEDTGRLDKPLQPSAANAIFAGFVDESTLTFDDTHRVVKFEGRDFTSLLIDQKYKENVPMSLENPVNVTIRTFLAAIPATAKIQLVEKRGKWLGTKYENPSLDPLSKFSPDPTSDSPLGRMKNPGAKESYWDIIQDMVLRSGLICFVHLDQLILTEARNLFSSARDCKFIYGKNIKTLTFKRKIGRLKGFNMKVIARAGSGVVEAKIPEEATEAWCKAYGIDRAAVQVPVLKPDGSIDTSQMHVAPYITFVVQGVANKDQLIVVGQSSYEEYSRQQLEGSLETKEMVSHAGLDEKDKNWHSYNLTQLQIGQPLEVAIDMDDLSQIAQIRNANQRTNYLLKKNYPKDVAAAFASTMGKFSPRFYTKQYSISLDNDSGFKLHVDIINIIENKNKGL